ncbi:hypothetical protein Hdeb2414_s0006g00203381 [Helianthus debilis subsp. tardiflorus]
MAKSGKLEIVIMPIVVQIDKLALVLEENDDVDSRRSTSSAQHLLVHQKAVVMDLLRRLVYVKLSPLTISYLFEVQLFRLDS